MMKKKIFFPLFILTAIVIGSSLVLFKAKYSMMDWKIINSDLHYNLFNYSTTGKLITVSDELLTNEELTKKVRVLCWIMTQPGNHQTKARAIKDTWAKRCTVYLFISSKEDASLPAISVSLSDNYNKIWGKTKRAFKYVYEHHLNDADWFMKADDDTYVIVENLRYLLNNFSSDEPIWFGHRFRKFLNQGYMSGGAGYVLSKEALTRFVKQALRDPLICKSADDSGAEDAEMGRCLQNVGVLPMDSRDEFGRQKFFPFIPEHHLSSGIDKTFWFFDYSYYPIRQGRDCCSDLAITFHYVPYQDMKVLDFFLYNLRPYGVDYSIRQDPKLANLTDIYDNSIPEIPFSTL